MSDAVGPNTRAKRLTGRDYISYSAVATHQQCPLKYRFRYIDRLPERFLSANLAFGSAIHGAVELHFNALMLGKAVPSLDDLLEAYHEAWESRKEKTIRYRRGEDRAHHTGVAMRMLRAFQGSHLARPDGTILGVEKELRGAVISDCPDLLGRIDLLVETAGALTVTDLKTARSPWSATQAALAGDQLLLYAELVRDMAPHKTVHLNFAVITKSKTPSIDIHAVRASPERVEHTTRVVQHVWQAIEAGHFHPLPSATICSACPFQEPCRAERGLRP